MEDILERKFEMTQVFIEDGTLTSITVVEACPNVVLRKRTVENDGYEAVQLGFEDVRETRSAKGEAGHAAKASTAPKRFVKEVRDSKFADLELGAEVNIGIFSAEETVDVIGTSKGRGFMGTIVRNSAKIGPKSHDSGHHRHIGSLATNGITSRQGKILKGTMMAGQEDGHRTTDRNLAVIKVDIKNNYLLIKGNVPGPKRGMVMVRTAKCSKGNTEPVTLVDYTKEEEQKIPKMIVLSQTGKELNEITLADTVFGIEPDRQCIFDAAIMQRASIRQGTHDTKSRTEVRDDGRKPWRQKGTGRVRQGSICATQWRSEGIVFGPTPRNYGYKLDKKVRRLALKSALPEKVLENAMGVVDEFELEALKSKTFNQIIADINASKKTLSVVSEGEDFENAFLGIRNTPTMVMLTADGLNVYDIVDASKIVFTEAAAKGVEEALA